MLPIQAGDEVRPSRCLHTTRGKVSSGLAVFLTPGQTPGSFTRNAHEERLPYYLQERIIILLYHYIIAKWLLQAHFQDI